MIILANKDVLFFNYSFLLTFKLILLTNIQVNYWWGQMHCGPPNPTNAAAPPWPGDHTHGPPTSSADDVGGPCVWSPGHTGLSGRGGATVQNAIIQTQHSKVSTGLIHSTGPVQSTRRWTVRSLIGMPDTLHPDPIRHRYSNIGPDSIPIR